MNDIPTKWPDTPSIMTDEIAFELGRNRFPHMFYTHVFWYPNVEPFRLVHFFDWYGPSCHGDNKGSYSWSFSGSLKKDAITTDAHRRAYLRGALAGSGKRVSDTQVSFSDANACERFKALARMFKDIRYNEDGSLSDMLLNGPKIRQDAWYAVPICSNLTIESTKSHLDDVFGPVTP